MTQPVVDEKIEYITQKSVDILLQTLVDRIEESDEAHRKQVEQLAENLERKIEQGKADNLASMQQVMDDRFAREEAKRKSDIESLKGEIKGDLGSMNSKLDEALKGVSKITGLMESLPDQLRIRDEKVAETHKRFESQIQTQETVLTEVRRDNDLHTSSIASLTEKTSRLQATIHGDPNNKDDVPSLFGKLSQIETQVTQGFVNVGIRLDSAMAQVGQVSADVATINRERADEKARWEQWMGTVRGGVKTFFGNKWVQWALAALAAGIVVTIFPELREVISKLLLGEIQGG